MVTGERRPHLAVVANSDAELLETEARLRALEAKMEGLPEEKNVDLVIGVLADQCIPLRMQIAEVPAVGIGGIVVKLRQVLATITDLGTDIRTTEWDEPTLRTALEAAERLARGGGEPAGDDARKGGRLH